MKKPPPDNLIIEDALARAPGLAVPEAGTHSTCLDHTRNAHSALLARLKEMHIFPLHCLRILTQKTLIKLYSNVLLGSVDPSVWDQMRLLGLQHCNISSSSGNSTASSTSSSILGS